MMEQYELLCEYLTKFTEKTKEYLPQVKKDAIYNSIIIENRVVINFEQILKNHIYFLNKNTELLKSIEFWELVEGEIILNFQIDSLLLRDNIEEFLYYDFIGAPWSKPKEGKFVGNGGLSIRNKLRN
jgi:hypothetical protein